VEKDKKYPQLPHMEDSTMDKIVEKLTQMRDESSKSVNHTVQKDLTPNQVEGDVGDDIDKATVAREREFSLLIHERHLRRLQQIDEAFERIKDGTYGLCEGTEEPINPKRLLIMPLAKYSLEYQQEQEKSMGRGMGETEWEESESFDNEE